MAAGVEGLHDGGGEHLALGFIGVLLPKNQVQDGRAWHGHLGGFEGEGLPCSSEGLDHEVGTAALGCGDDGGLFVGVEVGHDKSFPCANSTTFSRIRFISSATASQPIAKTRSLFVSSVLCRWAITAAQSRVSSRWWRSLVKVSLRVTRPPL